MGSLGLLLLLAVLQGLTEFLPVSSSGHLVLAREWLPAGSLLPRDASVEVVLHLGTLLAVVLFYGRDLIRLGQGLLGRGEEVLAQRRLLVLLGVATLPILAVGLGLRDWVEASFADGAVVPWGLLGTGFFLWFSRRGRCDRGLAEMSLALALGIGLAQSVAILPGVSRSGVTIAVALFFGLRGESAARFSFLLSIPAILGAAILKLPDVAATEGIHFGQLGAAAGLSFLVGFVSLGILVRVTRVKKLSWFAPYCWLLGVVALVLG